jgi:hypothetical protein
LRSRGQIVFATAGVTCFSQADFQAELLPTTSIAFGISIAANSMAEAKDEDAQREYFMERSARDGSLPARFYAGPLEQRS